MLKFDYKRQLQPLNNLVSTQGRRNKSSKESRKSGIEQKCRISNVAMYMSSTDVMSSIKLSNMFQLSLTTFTRYRYM